MTTLYDAKRSALRLGRREQPAHVRFRPARSGATPSPPGASTSRPRPTSTCCAPRASTSRRAPAGCRPPSSPPGATAGRSSARYAEYDAVPGNSQQPVPYQAPREGLHPYAAGHTDPHSMLGTAALTGVLAREGGDGAARLPGTLRFFGEPAEKVCGSKPVHAAKGYYDGVDAFIAYHPLNANTAVWETHCGAYWSAVFTFECAHPERWGSTPTRPGRATTAPPAPTPPPAVPGAHRRPLPDVHHDQVHQGGDVPAHRHLDPQRVHPRRRRRHLRQPAAPLQPDPVLLALAPARRPGADLPVLENNAKHVAATTGCEAYVRWVTKTRVGLANNAMADLTYRNMELVGPPTYSDEARAFGREIQRDLGPGADGRAVPGRLHARSPRRRSTRPQTRSLPAALAEELHLRRLCRLHLARPDRPPLHRPPGAAAAPPRLRVPDLGLPTRSAAWPRAVDPGHVRSPARRSPATMLDLLTAPAELAKAHRPSSASAPAAASAGRSGWRRCCRRTSCRRSTCAGRSTSRRCAARSGGSRRRTRRRGSGSGDSVTRRIEDQHGTREGKQANA